MMWQYMKHDSGLGLVRCDWDARVFESYHGKGKWVEDTTGLELWSGASSAGLHYSEIEETEVTEIMSKIDERIGN